MCFFYFWVGNEIAIKPVLRQRAGWMPLLGDFPGPFVVVSEPRFIVFRPRFFFGLQSVVSC